MTMSEPSKSATRVAVLGYGVEAREHAHRLREQGWRVSVVVRPGGMSWIHAVADGLRPVTAREAVAEADVVAVALPEAEQPAMWAYTLAPLVAKGALIVFTHGAALYTGAIAPDAGFDVVLVAPGDSPGACRVAVHQDATGRALERAAGYARAVFAGAKVGTTTLASEVQSELAELIDRVGGVAALLAEWDHVLANPGHEPDEATLRYYDGLRATVLAESTARISLPPGSMARIDRVPGTPGSRGAA
jgi:ketol-acid reductoisomerase